MQIDYSPAGIIVVIDDLHRLLSEVTSLDGTQEIDPGKRSLAANLLTRLREYVQVVKEQAVARRLGTDGIMEFQAKLMQLVREHPDPVAALSRFRGLFDDAELAKIVMTSGPLKVAAEQEVKAEAMAGGGAATPVEQVDHQSGEVTNPVDPTAYFSAKVILAEHGPSDRTLTHKQLAETILPEHPEIRRWHPHRNRLKIHLADWLGYVRSLSEPAASDGGWASPAQVEKNKNDMQKRKHRGK